MVSRIFSGVATPVVAQTSAIGGLKETADATMSTVHMIIDKIVGFFVNYSFQFLGGVIILAAGWFVANFLATNLRNFLLEKKVDVTVSKFLAGGVRLTVLIFAGLAALGKFGFEIAPLIAGLSVVGFGTSFALQGPLSNYVAGATLIFTKPFKVGDIIEVVGQVGEVEDMALPRTILRTIDGDKVIIPNKHIIGEIIQNYSEFKRLDLVVGIAYESDVNKAIDVMREVIVADEKVLKGREPKIGIDAFADSSINIFARLWCLQSDYWDVKFRLHKAIWEAFQKNGIVIPFPQRDVHLIPSG